MSEEKDKMHLAELEDDVLGDRPIPFTENLYKNYRELASAEIEDLMQQRDELKARIKELEEKLNNEWKDIKDAPRDQFIAGGRNVDGEWRWEKCAWVEKYSISIDSELSMDCELSHFDVCPETTKTTLPEGWYTVRCDGLDDVYFSINPTHYKLFTPPSTQEGDKE